MRLTAAYGTRYHKIYKYLREVLGRFEYFMYLCPRFKEKDNVTC